MQLILDYEVCSVAVMTRFEKLPKDRQAALGSILGCLKIFSRRQRYPVESLAAVVFRARPSETTAIKTLLSIGLKIETSGNYVLFVAQGKDICSLLTKKLNSYHKKDST